MITWRCWSKTLSALLATSKIVTFATRLNTSQGRINRENTMTYQDCVLTAATDMLDRDLPIELLPLAITSHAGSLLGWEADRLGTPAWD